MGRLSLDLSTRHGSGTSQDFSTRPQQSDTHGLNQKGLNQKGYADAVLFFLFGTRSRYLFFFVAFAHPHDKVDVGFCNLLITLD